MRDSESLTWERCAFNDVFYPGASRKESFRKVKWGRRLQEPHARGKGMRRWEVYPQMCFGGTRVIAAVFEAGLV